MILLITSVWQEIIWSQRRTNRHRIIFSTLDFFAHFFQLEFKKNLTCRGHPDIELQRYPAGVPNIIIPRAQGIFEDDFPIRQQGICHRSLEGIQDTKILQVVMPRSHNRKTFSHFSPSRSPQVLPPVLLFYGVRLPGQRLVFAATNPELQDAENSKGRGHESRIFPPNASMNAPWDWYLYFTTSMVDFLMVNVGKHTCPMDPVGI